MLLLITLGVFPFKTFKMWEGEKMKKVMDVYELPLNSTHFITFSIRRGNAIFKCVLSVEFKQIHTFTYGNYRVFCNFNSGVQLSDWRIGGCGLQEIEENLN